MQLDAQQIGANVMSQLEKLYERRKHLEEKVKTELEAVNAEIVALERLAGLRKRPGKPKGSKSAEKSTTDYIAVARAVLEAHRGTACTVSEIAQLALATGLWTCPPKLTTANLSRALGKVDPEETNIWQTDDKKFFMPADDSFE